MSPRAPVPPPPAGAPNPFPPQPKEQADSHGPTLHYGGDPFQPEQKRPKGSPKAALLVATLLACVAVGISYYAYLLWDGKRNTEVALDTAKGEVARLQKMSDAESERVEVLEKEKVETSSELGEVQAQLRDVSAQLAAAEGRLDELNEQRAEIQERLAEFRRFTKAFQRMIDSGQLEVNFRRGRMIVELPAQVLFPSGSADLTDDGQKSLTEVAKVLRKIRGKHFIVGGHTDNVPVSTAEFPSNWELSAARAVNVTHALIRAGLRPQGLVAAGYGPYDPVATNKSSRGRQRNRRIEIILEPNLRDVPGLDE